MIELELIGRDGAAEFDQHRTPGMSGYDVFLAHNTKQKDDVERVARSLEQRGLRPWFDKWEVPPGSLFQDELSRGISESRAIAVFVGHDGVGPWQDLEQKAALSEFVARKAPVIPVLLGGVEDKCLPAFLRQFNYVQISDALPYAESISQLVWGIKRRAQGMH